MGYKFTTSLPYLLNRIGIRMGEVFSERLNEYQLTIPMYRVLAVLKQEGKQSLSDLSKILLVEISTLSRLITTMKNKGLVSRKRIESNARMVEIDLTPQGNLLIEKLMPIAMEIESLSTSAFSESEIERLKKSLSKLLENKEIFY